MIRIENMPSYTTNNINRQNNTTSYKGNIPVRVFSREDLDKQVQSLMREAQVTGAIDSPNFFAGAINLAKDIAEIIKAGRVTRQEVKRIDTNLNLSA